ncbi:hypothetical protein [Actinomyces ruminis]|nr:hypothetical protein [Actinomyces ruminis]
MTHVLGGGDFTDAGAQLLHALARAGADLDDVHTVQALAGQ